MRYGLTLSAEEHDPRRLVDMARLAEQHQFDFVSVSDHFHPWVSAQGHSPFVWSVLGAIASSTTRIEVGVGVTCPTTRIHPAILAQATATTACLLDGRLVWGVGTGENLNEHILGQHWPPYEIRAAMLEEAIGVIRRLWTEESVTHRGRYYTVEDARILDRPREPAPILISAFGDASARLAARIGDGLWVSGPAADTIEVFREAGGTGPIYSQITLCWGEEKQKAIELAHRMWPNTALPGQLAQDLPTMLHFEQAVELVTPKMIAGEVPCGPDPDPVIDRAREAIEAGIDHLYFHQIGPDQEGFIHFWESRIRDALTS
jgi:G6PDH family F420-dependent oxidoreductase